MVSPDENVFGMVKLSEAIYIRLQKKQTQKRITLSKSEILTATDTSEIKRMSTQVDALVKCIKGERTALGLPNHIVGMTTEGGEVIL